MTETFDYLRNRSVIDDVGCWHWRGAKSTHGRPIVWISSLKITASLGTFLSLVTTGQRPPKGMGWRATCTRDCCNPEHQKLVPSRGREGRMSPLNRAKLTAGIRAVSKCTPEIAAAIRSSSETGLVLAARHGMTPQNVSLIRRNKSWAPAANSVFGWRP